MHFSLKTSFLSNQIKKNQVMLKAGYRAEHTGCKSLLMIRLSKNCYKYSNFCGQYVLLHHLAGSVQIPIRHHAKNGSNNCSWYLLSLMVPWNMGLTHLQRKTAIHTPTFIGYKGKSVHCSIGNSDPDKYHHTLAEKR